MMTTFTFTDELLKFIPKYFYAALFYGIPCILMIGSDEKMFRIYAVSCVTFMANKFSFWYRSAMDKIRISMNKHSFMGANFKCPISIFHSCSFIEPTTVSLCHESKQPDFWRRRFWSCFHGGSFLCLAS